MEEIPLWYWLAVFFALGACVGSFYNVIVYRMPRGISLINPPSHCPLCKKRIPIRYNLPIVGWLWLRGKSACCHQPISVIYPVGEALCGLLGALSLFASVAVVGTAPVTPELFRMPVSDPAVWAGALAMAWLLLGAYPVCAVDCKYKLIPDSISVGGIVAGLLISIIPGGVTPLQSLLGAVVAGGGLYLVGWVVGPYVIVLRCRQVEGLAGHHVDDFVLDRDNRRTRAVHDVRRVACGVAVVVGDADNAVVVERCRGGFPSGAKG